MAMFPSSSIKQSNFHNEPLFPFWMKSSDDVVTDLLLAVQNIIAGTITVSNKMLSETCMEYKIKLPSVSPIIKLEYEWKPDHVDLMHLIPILEYGISDEDNEQNSDTIISKYDVVCDVTAEKPNRLAKQLVLNDHLQENESKRKITICTKPISDSVNNLNESVGSSTENEIITTSSGNLDVTISQGKKYDWNCENVALRDNLEGIAKNHSNNEHQRNTTVMENPPFLCNYCGKSFMTKCDQICHEAIHSSEKTFKCEKCGKSFTVLKNLARHRKAHTCKKPLKCEQCGKIFVRRDHLIEHGRIHTGERPFVCELCGKSFSESSGLCKHKKIHLGEKPFICEHCGKAFSKSSNLTVHKRIHSGEKPFTCEFCDKSFTQLGNLCSHKRIHSGEKPFVCEYCDKSFSQAGVLYRHKKIHLGEMSSTRE